jgi:hypothetical protein
MLSLPEASYGMPHAPLHHDTLGTARGTASPKVAKSLIVGLSRVIFSVNVGTKRRCFRAEPFIFSGRYKDLQD